MPRSERSCVGEIDRLVSYWRAHEDVLGSDIHEARRRGGKPDPGRAAAAKRLEAKRLVASKSAPLPPLGGPVKQAAAGSAKYLEAKKQTSAARRLPARRRRTDIFDVVPADAWCLALSMLEAPRTLCAMRALSKRAAAWLDPALESSWRRLDGRAWDFVRPLDAAPPGPAAAAPTEARMLEPGYWERRYRTCLECETSAVVVEVGSSQLRYGLASWAAPAAVDLDYEDGGALRPRDAGPSASRRARGPESDLHLCECAPPLPPPPLMQQRLAAEDPAALEAAIFAAAKRLGVEARGLSVVVVLSPFVDVDRARRRLARRLVGEGSLRRLRLERHGDAVWAAEGGAAARHHFAIVVDVGHFHTSVSALAAAPAAAARDDAAPHAPSLKVHQRLAGAACTAYVHQRLREQAWGDGAPASAADAERALVRCSDGARPPADAKLHASLRQVCGALLCRPASGGSGLEAVLGEDLAGVLSLGDLVGRVARAAALRGPAPRALAVAVAGGGAALAPTLDADLAAELAALSAAAKVPFALVNASRDATARRRRRTAAWRGAATRFLEDPRWD
ncbi:hypothetical protein M885DRAFT_508476 [Pelagophyceae sp. CCMP2097]|nr:hypothetical protein M885DRAFT_508476 [Pelagophyceae sp. CCMP2097]